jgi:hypothetical protein
VIAAATAASAANTEATARRRWANTDRRHPLIMIDSTLNSAVIDPQMTICPMSPRSFQDNPTTNVSAPTVTAAPR